jgi:hypothetical protein
VKVTIADDINTQLANSSVPALSYDALLGVPELEAGIFYQRIQDEVVTNTALIKALGDFLQFPQTTITAILSDANNTFMVLRSHLPYPEVLKPERGDKLRIVVRDDLTGLSRLRILASGRSETRPL